jgi:hypothetical protein
VGLLNINGYAIIRGSIRLPRVGVWNADIVVNTADSITGPVVLETADGAFSLHGTAYRQGIFQQTLSMRVIGGAGGLSTPPGGIGSALTPKFYQGATVRLVLGDILAACGEQLSTTSDTAVLATVLRRWVVMGGPGKEALARLLEPLNVSWRVLPDGSVWVGTEKWPAAPSTQFDLIERHYGEGRVVIGSEQPFLMPGTLLTISSSSTQGTQYVSYVVHSISPEKIRSEAFFSRTYVGAA